MALRGLVTSSAQQGVHARIADEHLGDVWTLRKPEEKHFDEIVNRLLRKGIAAEKLDREGDIAAAPGID
jgi:hypothetical protein